LHKTTAGTDGGYAIYTKGKKGDFYLFFQYLAEVNLPQKGQSA